MNFYSKSYISIGGYKCRMWYHFSINFIIDKTMYDKFYGYNDWYYDGTFYHFNLYPIRIDWWKRPEIIK